MHFIIFFYSVLFLRSEALREKLQPSSLSFLFHPGRPHSPKIADRRRCRIRSKPRENVLAVAVVGHVKIGHRSQRSPVYYNCSLLHFPVLPYFAIYPYFISVPCSLFSSLCSLSPCRLQYHDRTQPRRPVIQKIRFSIQIIPATICPRIAPKV